MPITPTLYAKPAFITRDNICNQLTYAALIQSGITVRDWTPSCAHCPRGIGLHLHWPEGLLRGKAASVPLKLAAFGLYLDFLKARGRRLIWTAHNVEPHSDYPLEMVRRFWATLLPRLDGIIAPSRTALTQVQELLSSNQASPRVVFAPFGGYPLARGASTDRALNRVKYGLPPNARIGCMIGRLVGYRQLVSTAETFVRANVEGVMLLIAGSPTCVETTARLAVIARQYPQVKLFDRTLMQQEFDELLVASDVALFPYHKITNSGAVLHALSRNVACITSELPLFRELALEFGSDRVNMISKSFRWWEHQTALVDALRVVESTWITSRWETHAEAIRSLLIQ